MDTNKAIAVVFVLCLVMVTGCSGNKNKHAVPSGDTAPGGSFAVNGVNPASASAGTALVITGTGFGASQGSVRFGDTGVTADAWSDTSISVQVPDLEAGSVQITVVSGTRSGSIGFIIVPFVSGINTQDAIINDTLHIRGTGFGINQGSGTVNYAGTLLPVTSWTNNEVAVTVSNLTHAAAGSLNLIVNNTVSNGITLTVHPWISSVSPDTAERSDEVSVAGNLFGSNQGNNSIAFSGITAAVISWADDRIRAIVPDSAVKGGVTVLVNNIPSAGRGFTVTKTFSTINRPRGLAADENANLYVANHADGTILRVMPGGVTQTTVYRGLKDPTGLFYQPPDTLFAACAGDGTIRKIVLGNPVTGYTFASGFSMPAGIARDDAGRMYVTNYGSNSISMIELDGTVSTFATGLNKPMGIVFTGPSGAKSFKVINNGNGTIDAVDGTGVVTPYVSGLDGPKYVISDDTYNLYVTSGNGIIRILSPSGAAVPYADGLGNPYGLVMDAAGHVYVSDFDTNSISMINGGYEVYADGLNNPWGIVFTSTGTLFIANQGSPVTGGGSLSTVTTEGQVLSFANMPGRSACTSGPDGGGTSRPMDITTGFQDKLFVSMRNTHYGATLSVVTYDGDAHLFGDCSLYAGFGNLSNPAYDLGSGLLYVSDTQHGRVFSMTSSGSMLQSFASGFSEPAGMTVDQTGKVYIANAGNGTISQTTAAGTFTTTYASGFSRPSGIAFDGTGNLYVSGYGNDSVSLVTPEGQVYTVATGIPKPTGIAMDPAGYMYVASETGGKVYRLIHTVSPYAYGFNTLQGLSQGTDGLVYIADSSNNGIYRLEPTGSLTRLAAAEVSPSWIAFGNDSSLFLSDFTGGSLRKLSNGVESTFANGLNGPTGLAYDASSNLWYVADYLDNTLSLINSTGNVSTLAVGLSGPLGVAFLSPGNLYVANSADGAVAKVIQGSGVSTFASGFGLPAGIVLDNMHNLYVADQTTGFVYLVDPDGAVSPFAGINSPYGIAFDGSGNLFVSDTQDRQIKEIVLH